MNEYEKAIFDEDSEEFYKIVDSYAKTVGASSYEEMMAVPEFKAGFDSVNRENYNNTTDLKSPYPNNSIEELKWMNGAFYHGFVREFYWHKQRGQGRGYIDSAIMAMWYRDNMIKELKHTTQFVLKRIDFRGNHVVSLSFMVKDIKQMSIGGNTTAMHQKMKEKCIEIMTEFGYIQEVKE